MQNETLDGVSAGFLFRAEREKKHLSLETVSQKLNISVDKVEKLEYEDFNWLELSPFERGYVRNYASLLGIPGSKYEHLFPASENVMSELYSVKRFCKHTNGQSCPDFKMIRTVFLLALVVGIGIMGWAFWPSGLEASDGLFLNSDELQELHKRSLTD